MPDFLKDYEPVEDRLRAFWKDHPEGRVMTTLIAHTDGDYIVFAEVWRSAGDLPAASGLAHDSAAQLPPNMKTSALEVAETSAIGRALANLGYAAKGKRPSREEMSKASPAVSEPAGERGVASKGEGQGVIPPPSSGADKQVTSPADAGHHRVRGPVASSAGGTSSAPDNTGQKTGLGEAGADASASSGEVGADMKPEEGVTASRDKPSPGFPISPEKCDHKTSAGRWVKWVMIAPDFGERCPKCGTPKLIAMESGGPYS